jgi:hypothetical protein
MKMEEGYRLLAVGEPLMCNDEYIRPDGTSWAKTERLTQFVVNGDYYRRKIEPADGWICIEKQQPDKFPCWVWGFNGGVEASNGVEKFGGRWYSAVRDAYPITLWKPMQLPEPPIPEVSNSEKAFDAWWQSTRSPCDATPKHSAKQIWLAALQYAKDETDRKGSEPR